MAEYCVIDTIVLQSANARLTARPRPKSLFMRRVRLLEEIQAGRLIVMTSSHLLAEYERQLPDHRNDYVRAFFELALNPKKGVTNWRTPWAGRHRQAARECRYPREDYHVLRTACREDGSSTIYTEEARQLSAHPCIRKSFQVSISAPP